MDPLAERTLNIAREALDVDDTTARGDCVRRLCGGDDDLEQRVLRLIGDAEAMTHDEPRHGGGAPLETFHAGDSFGPYRLLRPLGEGGMGAVWLAERADGVFQRQVALKLLRGGWLRPDRHFRRERDILARLGHPNIAQLYDGGASGDQPWFALEYVDGETITAWCDRQRFDLRRRVRLLLPICAAVQFAHQNLVVHRDIKPANVLVTSGGTPKLLDFGIARLVDQGDARQTQTLAMTPAYASPEQRRGDTVRTPSDVFQLGLLLFELLVGRSVHEARGDGEARRVPRPDAAFQALADAQRIPIAQARSTSPERLRALLRGDLARIVAKATAELEVERYASPQALAQDLEAWLAGRPVRAHRGSLGYRARKFLRRNWAPSLAVLAMIVASAYYVVELAEKNRRIGEERDRAIVVAGFLEELFRGANPYETGSPDLSARELLDRGVERLERETRLGDMTRARLQVTMARSYQGLGIYDSARGLYARALATFRDQSGEATVAARALKDSVASALEASDPEGAERDLADALALLRDLGDGAGIEAAYAHAAAAMSLGNLLRPSEADLHYAWLAAARAQLFDADPGFFAEMSLLHADSEAANRRPERAVEVGREAVALTARAFGERSPVHARALVALAGALTDTRRYAEAEQRYATAVDRLRASLGARHRMVGTTLNDLGLLYLRLGRFGEARAALEEAVDITTEVYGSDHVYLVSPLLHLGWTAIEAGDLATARRLVERAAALAAVSGYPVYVARAEHARAAIDCREGHRETALAGFASALDTYEREAPLLRAPVLRAHLAACLAAAGRDGEAIALLPQAIDGLARGIGAETWDAQEAQRLLVRLQARAAPSR